MIEYKVVENPPNRGVCENMLNELAEEGWEVVSFGQFQICLEREKQNEVKTTEQICG